MKTNCWMIKWNPDAKENKDLEQDWRTYLYPHLKKGAARVLTNKCSKVEELTSQSFRAVKSGDVIFAYQARKGKLHGFCIATGTHFDGGHRWVDFVAAYGFDAPVNLLRLKPKNIGLKNLECLQPSLPRTLYRLSKSDADLIFSVCLDGTKSRVAAKVREFMDKQGGNKS